MVITQISLPLNIGESGLDVDNSGIEALKAHDGRRKLTWSSRRISNAKEDPMSVFTNFCRVFVVPRAWPKVSLHNLDGAAPCAAVKTRAPLNNFLFGR